MTFKEAHEKKNGSLNTTEDRLENVVHTDKTFSAVLSEDSPSFELVQGISSRLYVYAALWNAQNVRLITIKVQGYVFKKLFCVIYYVWDRDKISPGISVKPNVKELHTKPSLYTSASISCPIKPKENRDVPLFVGLVEGKATTPKRMFQVENRGQKNKSDSELLGVSQRNVPMEFTVCIPPLHNVTSAAQVVEKIEMTRLLGAGRVVLYNTSISSNVNAVFKMYAREWADGRETLEVVVMPWKLPSENGKLINIPYWAQQLAIDDCLHRFKRLSKYMVFNDLDEFLIPLKHENWSALVAERRRLKPQSIGWLFRSSVVNKDRPSPARGFEKDYKLHGSAVLGLTSRDTYVYQTKKRPKLIVDPTTIEEMGVHLIFKGRGSTDNLPLDIGMLYHYRLPLEECTPQTVDTRVVKKFGRRLVARLKKIWSKLPGVQLGWTPFKASDKSRCKYSD